MCALLTVEKLHRLNAFWIWKRFTRKVQTQWDECEDKQKREIATRIIINWRFQPIDFIDRREQMSPWCTFNGVRTQRFFKDKSQQTMVAKREEEKTQIEPNVKGERKRMKYSRLPRQFNVVRIWFSQRLTLMVSAYGIPFE